MFPLYFNIEKFWENYIFLADYTRDSPDSCVCLSSKKYHQCSYVKILLYHKFPVKICSQGSKVLWNKSSIYLAFSLRCLILLHTVIILIFYASWVPQCESIMVILHNGLLCFHPEISISMLLNWIIKFGPSSWKTPSFWVWLHNNY